MPAGLTQLQVVNRALTEIARGQAVTSLTLTAPGIYAATLYTGAVQTLLRQQDWEFARKVAALSLTGNAAPLGWTYEYRYPVDCMRLRSVVDPAASRNDPQAIRWDVGTDLVSSTPSTVIWTSVASANAVYSTSAVTEADWDSMFTEAMVRLLGSELAMPVAGRPDFSKEFLDVAGRIGAAGMDRDS